MNEVLGYDKEGKEISPVKPGRVTTSCCVSCIVCGHMISGSGGPKHGAQCVECFKGEVSQENDFYMFMNLGDELRRFIVSNNDIIQNPGMVVSADDIDKWEAEAREKVEKEVNEYIRHVRRVAYNLRNGRYVK